MAAGDLVNKGVIFRRGTPVGPAAAAAGRMFLVSGIGRGGTAMLANLVREALLHKAGIVSGDADPVHDTFEVIEALRSRKA